MAAAPVNAKLGFTARGTDADLTFRTDATLTAKLLSGYLARCCS